MIVFITATDTQTISNLTVMGPVVSLGNTLLQEGQAIRQNLIAALAAQPLAPFLALCHGEPDHIVGQDALLATGVTDVALLQSRTNFALACHTSAKIGPAVAQAGGTWLGYSGPVSCLIDEAQTLQHFTFVAEYISHNFAHVNDYATAESFLGGLDVVTGSAFDAIDAAGYGDMENLHALRDITRRLRIWVPLSHLPTKHAEATPEPLFG